jgi:hypothetical protein
MGPEIASIADAANLQKVYIVYLYLCTGKASKVKALKAPVALPTKNKK